MNFLFGIIYILVALLIPAAIFVIAYFMIKAAVKNGILDAYKEIHKDQE